MYDFNFADLLVAGRRHRKLLLLTSLAGMILLGAQAVFLAPREWTSTTTIVLGNQTSAASNLSAMLSGMAGVSLASEGPSTDMYEVLLRSRETRRQVVEACGLQQVFGKSRLEDAIESLGTAARVDTQPPSTVLLSVSLSGTPRGLQPPEDSDRAIRELTVTCINKYLEILQKQLDTLRISSSKSQRVFLESQIPQARSKLYAAQQALADWQAREGLPAPTKLGDTLADELAEVQKNLTAAEIEARGQGQAAAQAQRLLREQSEMVPGTRTETRNPQIEALSENLADLEKRLAEERVFNHKTDEHPDVRQLLVQKEEVLAQLAAAYQQSLQPASASETRNTAFDALRTQLLSAQVAQAAADSRAQGLRSVLAQGRARVNALVGAGTEYARLYQNVQLAGAVYETVVKQHEAARLSEKAEEPIFFVIDPPTVPHKKSAPSTSVSLVTGLLLGFLLGLGLAYRRELRLAAAAPAAPVQG